MTRRLLAAGAATHDFSWRKLPTFTGFRRENLRVTIRVTWLCAVLLLAAVSCAASPNSQMSTSASTTVTTPSVAVLPTMTRDQGEAFQGRVDAALDEINPAKDTLVAALQTGDVAAIHIGCRPIGQAGRDLSAALAEGHGYALPNGMAVLVAQMQRAADDLQRAERDCLPLWTGSSQAEFDRLVTDMRSLADATHFVPK